MTCKCSKACVAIRNKAICECIRLVILLTFMLVHILYTEPNAYYLNTMVEPHIVGALRIWCVVCLLELINRVPMAILSVRGYVIYKTALSYINKRN